MVFAGDFYICARFNFCTFHPVSIAGFAIIGAHIPYFIADTLDKPRDFRLTLVFLFDIIFNHFVAVT